MGLIVEKRKKRIVKERVRDEASFVKWLRLRVNVRKKRGNQERNSYDQYFPCSVVGSRLTGLAPENKLTLKYQYAKLGS